MLKVLIAVDGSEHAQRTLAAVARLAQHTNGVDAVLLHVRDTPPYYGDLPPLDFESLDQLGKRKQDDVLQKALASAKAVGLTSVRAKGVSGLAAPEIVREAEIEGVDQIAMGTHGRGALGSLVIGSVAQRVLHLSKVPVLLVH